MDFLNVGKNGPRSRCESWQPGHFLARRIFAGSFIGQASPQKRTKTGRLGKRGNMVEALWIAGAVVLIVLAGLILLVLIHRRGEKRALDLFQRQRDALQQEYFRVAAASGKPRGLRWKACDWEDWVEFARQRKSGELVALVSVTIHFEAIAGGEMEDVAAVGLPRNATAVFFFRAGRWQTVGQRIANMNPDETIQFFREQYERLTLSGQKAG
jgi:hypothetical protein